MSTQKPRFMVTVSDEMRRQIDDYRFAHRCKSQTDAVTQLISIGLDALLGESAEPAEAPPPLDPAAAELLSLYDSLNAAGQSILLGTARGLAANPDMQKNGASQDATA